MSKIERTKQGSKNDWRITYDTGSQKWTDDRPGDGVGQGSGDLLKETLDEPAVQRGLQTISKAIKSGKGLKPAVDALVRDTGSAKGKTVLNAIYKDSKGSKQAGWDKARKLVSFDSKLYRLKRDYTGRVTGIRIAGMSFDKDWSTQRAHEIGALTSAMLRADSEAFGLKNHFLFDAVHSINDDGNFDQTGILQRKWMRATGAAYLNNFLLMREQFNKSAVEEEGVTMEKSEDRTYLDQFHVLLRAVDYTPIFKKPDEFEMFEHLPELLVRIDDFYENDEVPICAAVMDRIDTDDVKMQWFENEEGEKFYPSMDGDYQPPPEGYIYYHSRDTSLHHTVMQMIQADDVANCDHPLENRVTDHGWVEGMEGEKCTKCGGHYVRNVGETDFDWKADGMTTLMGMNNGWPEDLVMAMANEGVRLTNAIIIGATACERCMNSLAFEFGLDWGYEEGCDEWERCGTTCEFCKGMGFDGQNRKIASLKPSRLMRLADIRHDVDLKAEYRRFNAKLFGGELPTVTLGWNRSKRAGGIATGSINNRTGEITPKGIKISTFLKMDHDRFDKIMIHEMIHIWQFNNNINERQSGGHGRTFKQMAKKVGSKAGIIIPQTEDISGMEISEETKATAYVAVLWGGAPPHMSLFQRGAFDKNRTAIESYFEIRAITEKISAKFYSTQERELMKYAAMRQMPRRGIKFYRNVDASIIKAIRSNGELIGQTSDRKEPAPELVKIQKLMRGFGKFLVKSLESRFEPAKFGFNINIEGDRVKCLIMPQNGNAKGSILINAFPSNKTVRVFLMKDVIRAFSVEELNKLPTVRTVLSLIDKVEKKNGRAAMQDAWGIPLKNVAG